MQNIPIVTSLEYPQKPKMFITIPMLADRVPFQTGRWVSDNRENHTVWLLC